MAASPEIGSRIVIPAPPEEFRPLTTEAYKALRQVGDGTEGTDVFCFADRMHRLPLEKVARREGHPLSPEDVERLKLYGFDTTAPDQLATCEVCEVKFRPRFFAVVNNTTGEVRQDSERPGEPLLGGNYLMLFNSEKGGVAEVHAFCNPCIEDTRSKTVDEAGNVVPRTRSFWRDGEQVIEPYRLPTMTFAGANRRATAHNQELEFEQRKLMTRDARQKKLLAMSARRNGNGGRWDQRRRYHRDEKEKKSGEE